MANSSRAFVAILVAAVLAACSWAGNVASLTPQAQTLTNDADHAAKGTLTIRIRIPKEHHHVREPRYISAATEGMTMAFTGPSTFTQVINLTPSDPRCSGSPFTCTIVVALKPGRYTATVNTYDEAPVDGAIPAGANLLSTAHKVVLHVARGIANKFGVTLDGVPASITVGGFPSASAGTAFLPEPFTVTVKDADGYIIVGTYSTPITLTDSDTSGATSIATAGSDNPPAGELLSSSDTATISYTGRAIAPATIVASEGAVSGSGIFAVAFPVFVADTNNGAVKEIPPGCTMASCVRTVGGGFGVPVGVAADGSGNVFVTDDYSDAVDEIPPGCTSAMCVTTLTKGSFEPKGVAVDGSGDVFVAVGNVVEEVLSGSDLALGGGFSNPFGVAADGSGDVFVADAGNKAVKKFHAPDCTSVSCVMTVRGGFKSPAGVAVNGSGDVFVTDSGNNTVTEILRTCTRFCAIVLDGDFNAPESVAVDLSGNLFVADTGNNVVKEFPAGCYTIDCATTIGGGFNAPQGVAALH